MIKGLKRAAAMAGLAFTMALPVPALAQVGPIRDSDRSAGSVAHQAAPRAGRHGLDLNRSAVNRPGLVRGQSPAFAANDFGSRGGGVVVRAGNTQIVIHDRRSRRLVTTPPVHDRQAGSQRVEHQRQQRGHVDNGQHVQQQAHVSGRAVRSDRNQGVNSRVFRAQRFGHRSFGHRSFGHRSFRSFGHRSFRGGHRRRH